MSRLKQIAEAPFYVCLYLTGYLGAACIVGGMVYLLAWIVGKIGRVM